MSDPLPSEASKACPKCGAELSVGDTNGLCPACLMAEVMQPSQPDADAKPRRAAILTPKELAPLFPQYEILRILGRGGMGAVYLARQISLNRLVAIKVLPADLDDGSGLNFAQRFKNEAQAMAQLSHPGIVAVHDFGETSNGLLYIVMEYIEGTDVQLMLYEQGRLHSAHAMAIVAHVCDALAYAHARGIIHRDIKPSNIMVSNDGVVKVADFGLAKMSHSSQTTGITQSGVAMGTPHFMAPEALTLGIAVDQRADIYAVGVMLYQMLTGKLPQGLFEMPSLKVPGLDPRYDGIVAKALREDRALRYQNAGEMRHDLDAILTQPVVKAEPEAEKAPAAVPPPQQSKPHRPAGQPYRPPQPQVVVRTETRTSPVLWVMFLVLGGLAAFFFVERQRKANPTTSAPVVPTTAGTIPRSNDSNPAPAPPTAVSDPPNTTRRVVDLLPLVDVKRDAIRGVWQTTPTGLRLEVNFTPGVEGLHLPHAITGTDYDFEVEFTMEDLGGQRGGCSMQFPVGGTQVTWAPQVFAELARPWCGFLALDGKEAAESPKEIHVWKEPFAPGVKHSSIVKVRRGSLTGILNGTTFVHWQGDPGRFKRAVHALPLRDDRYLAVAGNFGGFTIHKAIVTEYVANASAAVKPTTGATPPDIESTAATSNVPMKAFTNSLGMKFVQIPGTKVLFCIHEARWQDYAAYAAENPGIDGTWKNQTYDGYVVTERKGEHPVTQVSWEDAQKFCAWLSKKEGKTYRLPTDAEWSIAVGTGRNEEWKADTTPATVFKDQTEFPWGTKWPPPKDSGNFGDESRKAKAPTASTQYLKDYEDGFPTTAPVMSFEPNKLGLYDLEGNVREWVEDWYDDSKKDRVLRGGCWGDYGRGYLLSSLRAHYAPGIRIDGYGFRCVIEVSSLKKGAVIATATSPAPSDKTITEDKLQMPATTLPTGPVTWTDTKGRSITATFKTIASGNVLLEIAGKVTPVALNTLSAESQKLARDYQQQVKPTANDPAKATKDTPFINSLGMKFVPVPGTKVLFCIHETRVKDYAAYAAIIKVDSSWTTQMKDGEPISRGPEYPVCGVSLDDGSAFCRWLTEREGGEGKLPHGMKYRLPTDEEWSRSVGLVNEQGATPKEKHGMNKVKFPWGLGYPPPATAGNFKDAAFHEKFPQESWIEGYTDNFSTTAPVGRFAPNQFGIYDLAGNVMEWCLDLYETGSSVRVLRGSSWLDYTSDELLSSRRFHGNPNFRFSRYGTSGFRCVIELSASVTAPVPTASSPTPNRPMSGAVSTPAANVKAPAPDPANATKDGPFINSLGMKFVPVPGTKVLMCIHETRRQDYAAYAAQTPGVDAEWKTPTIEGVSVEQEETHPVFSVNWADAQGFCRWLSKKERHAYRLPTDQEWSWAAGIGARESMRNTPSELHRGVKDMWPWGSEWPPPQGGGEPWRFVPRQSFPHAAIHRRIHGWVRHYRPSHDLLPQSTRYS